jgi:hypothetical protein
MDSESIFSKRSWLRNKLDLDHFKYDWQIEAVDKADILDCSSDNESDSEDSFDPMVSKIVDNQTRQYQLKLQMKAQTKTKTISNRDEFGPDSESREYKPKFNSFLVKYLDEQFEEKLQMSVCEEFPSLNDDEMRANMVRCFHSHDSVLAIRNKPK